MDFQLVLVKPEGFDYVESFRETMEVLQESLTALGHGSRIQVNRIDADAIPILFGAHHISPESASRLPPQAIIYNLEQLEPGYPWFQPHYMALLARHRVWDYSISNLQRLALPGRTQPLSLVPFGFAPCLKRIHNLDTPDVDVLFFGIQTERRLTVLRALGDRGLKVVALRNVWGAERDGWIARSKLVLNLHQSAHGKFEWVRILFLLANGKTVVTEVTGDGIPHPALASALCAVAYDGLVDACVALVTDDGRRAELAQRALVAAATSALQARPGIAHAVSALTPADFQATLTRQTRDRHADYREYAEKPALELPFERFAFYLPQFHRCAENDVHWGAGFTEWNNVSRALPRFAGHEQPRLPGELGYYDLAADHVLPRQVALARNYGISGFMFFYYWLEGRPVLELPVRRFRDDPSLELKYFFMWANENWTRRWDGQEAEVLLRQHYSTGDAEAMIRHMVRYFHDPRYLKVGARPVLAVYRADLVPDLAEYRAVWDRVCRENGFGTPYLIMAQAFANDDPRAASFDAAMQYPPHPGLVRRDFAPADIRPTLTAYDSEFCGRVFDYGSKVASELALAERPFRVFRCAFPAWDNSPRRRRGESWTFTNSSPGEFARWVRHLCREEADSPGPLRMVCINAWNEWGEGAYLEPDAHRGYAYLDALYEALDSYRDAQPEVREIACHRSPAPAALSAVTPALPAAAAPGTSLRETYIDLVRRSVIGLIHQDPPLAWDGKGLRRYDASDRELGRDWPSQAESMIGNRRMMQLQKAALQVIAENIPGDFIETGVWRGGACILLRAILKAYDIMDRKVWLADSFAGLPPPDEDHYPADRGDTHHEMTVLAVSLDAVKANFERYGLLDDQVGFLVGWFRDTLPTAPLHRLAILRLDGDMYESTMDALNALYKRVSPGGYVIVDDYGYIDSCRQAVEDFRRREGVTEPMEDIDGMGIYWRKAGKGAALK